MGMVVQHNMIANNTNRMLGVATGAVSKSTEKLSSGYRVNRAADDAAGLAISEKMRAQIRGLDKADTNAQDGISLIQTAEGALTETHSILQRMRELAIQASNGTETNDDRSNIQDEIEQLQEELDRISDTTEFNSMNLLDGNLDGSITSDGDSGPKFANYDTRLQAYITSNVAGVVVNINDVAKEGGESAIWSSDGKTLNLNLAKRTTYTQVEFDELIKNARQQLSTATASPAQITFKLKNGAYTTEPQVDMYDTNVAILGDIEVQDGYTITVIHEDAHCLNEEAVVNGTSVELHLFNKERYDQAKLDEILEGTGVKVNLKRGTDTGVKAESKVLKLFENTDTDYVGANSIKFKADKYGYDLSIGVRMNTFANSENDVGVTMTQSPEYAANGELTKPAIYTISLMTGTEYTEEEISKMFQKAGVPISVELSGNDPDEPNTLFVTDARTLSAKYDHTFVNTGNSTITYKTWTTKIDSYDRISDGKTPPTWTTIGIYYKTVSHTVTVDLSDITDETFFLDDEKLEMYHFGQEYNLPKYYSYTSNTFSNYEYHDERIDAPAVVDYGGVEGHGLGDTDAFLGEDNYGKDGFEDGMTLQIGANYGQTMSFVIDDMSSSALHVANGKVDVSTQKKAMESVDYIDKAIAIVSKQRALLGAVQNRLEHTISSLDNTSENLQSAESGIRDTDMASEMVTYSKYNILQQAGQSMLAQANQANQGVLSVIR